MKRLMFCWAAVIAVLLGGCEGKESTQDIAAVTGFDVTRYVGTWYEIARLPQSFERGMHHVTAQYSPNPDGTIKVANSGWRNGEFKESDGVAKFKGAADVGELQVSFFRPFFADYRVIHLEPDYSAAIVTGKNRGSLWILSRTPKLTDDRLVEYRNKAEAWGFDINRLEYPKQDVEEATEEP